MQCVGLQRLAVVFVGDAPQPARTPEVDDDRNAHHHKRPERRLDFDGMEEQTLARFVDDPDAGQQQQAGFDEGREALDLAVTVLVLGVGRLVGDTHREVGHERSHQVEPRVRRFGQNAQAAGGDSDHHLHHGDEDRGKNGIQSDAPFSRAACWPLLDGLAHILRLFTFRVHPPTGAAQQRLRCALCYDFCVYLPRPRRYYSRRNISSCYVLHCWHSRCRVPSHIHGYGQQSSDADAATGWPRRMPLRLAGQGNHSRCEQGSHDRARHHLEGRMPRQEWRRAEGLRFGSLTRQQFEQLTTALQPADKGPVPPEIRRRFATQYAKLLIFVRRRARAGSGERSQGAADFHLRPQPDSG